MDFQSQALERAKIEKEAMKLSRIIYRDKSIRLKENTLKLKDGDLTHAVIDHRGACGIVPIQENGNLLLVRQWRRAIERITIEIPAGTIEQGETPEETALRELSEETGYYPRSLIPICGFYPAPGFCTEFLHLYLAKDLEKREASPDKDEAIDVISVSFSEAKRMIKNQMILDAKTIIGLMHVLKDAF